MRRAAIMGGMLLLAGFMTVLPGAAIDSASAATPPQVEQCNDVFNGAATTVECHVVIANTFDIATGIGSAVVTTTICPAAVCGAATIANYPAVITSVVQCNGSGNAGGSSVICDVAITNTITGSVAVTPGSVNQCVGSGEGGGVEPTLNCGPPQNASGATLTQCNGSGNGGGGTLRVTCSFGALTETSALRVTINQCNGSSNGGGAIVTCSASETTTVIPAANGGTGQPGVTPPTARDLAYTGTTRDLWPMGLVGAITVLLGTSLLLHDARRRELQPLS